MKPSEIPLFLRTVRHVPPAQIAHRIRLRSKRAIYARFPNGLEERWASTVPSSEVGWPARFEPIDWAVQHEAPGYSDAGRGVFHLVGETHDALRDGWRPPERSQLFRYHLHYMEWAWPMANSGTEQDRDDFATLWKSWRAQTVPGRWDEWSPYVVSLRSWTLCGVFDALIRGTQLEDDVLRHLRACSKFLVTNLEHDVGGNHLIKNLKALLGLGSFLQDRTATSVAMNHLCKQLHRQILDDGGHFELSPSYHTQVLADLLDIRDLHHDVTPQIARQVSRYVDPMARWLSEMRFPDGSLPMLGDSTPSVNGILREIDRRTEPPPARPVAHLAASGYLMIRPQPDTAIVFDFGPPCPRELPAHAQADWGTFELWHKGKKLVADPGVSTYAGFRRDFERSTIAHNTATMNDANQTEVWGSFRAGNRHRPQEVCVQLSSESTTVIAGVLYAGIYHRRMVRVRDGSIAITDHFSPPCQIKQQLLIPRYVHEGNLLRVSWDDSASVATDPSEFACGFEILAPAMRRTATSLSPSTFVLEFDDQQCST